MNVLEGKLVAEGMKIGIVCARFNEFITSKLLGGAMDALVRHGVADSDVDVAWVPGAFEIPLAAQKMAATGKYDAILCLGAVIKGSTSHYDYVCAEVSKGIATVSLSSGLPVLFGVLTTVIDYVISNLLYYIWKMDPVPAQTIAWVAAVLFAFVTNKWWVFESHTLNPGKVWREFVSFVLCRVATFLFNLAALFVMVDLMKMEFFLCKLLISVVVVVLNYVFSKILIFTNDKKK